ncbi:hypothetical protein NC652_029379 [Populus alba x Populus x berolinensis]|nr:hypothetical protein NC652_029379 [Populus alba x Populus x berolinensis]
MLTAFISLPGSVMCSRLMVQKLEF